jgi:ATP synthase subunit 6
MKVQILPKVIFSIFGPLNQFDIVERTTCCYDVFLFLVGQTELDLAVSNILFFLICWQIYEYYNEEIKTDNVVAFDLELIIVDIINKKNFTYIDFIGGVFVLILFSNLSGLFPYSQTISAQLIFTLSISFISMFVIWLHSLYNNKLLMLNHFLPKGSPFIIIPFIILIELISNLSRIISIAVRLFANMTSGHALLKIIANFALISLALLIAFKILIIFPLVIIFIITLIEIIIAFLQTYVFVTLILIYISETE